MTYGRLAVAASLALLGFGAYLIFATGNGFAAVPYWFAAPLPALVAYGLFAEHTDRSVFELGREAGGEIGDAVDRAVRDGTPPDAVPGRPKPYLPDVDDWPPPDYP